MHATQFNLLDVPVSNLQSFRVCNSTHHKLHCTNDQLFGNNASRNDFRLFQVDEPPKGDVWDL
jgi:hypothetical protein